MPTRAHSPLTHTCTRSHKGMRTHAHTHAHMPNTPACTHSRTYLRNSKQQRTYPCLQFGSPHHVRPPPSERHRLQTLKACAFFPLYLANSDSLAHSSHCFLQTLTAFAFLPLYLATLTAFAFLPPYLANETTYEQLSQILEACLPARLQDTFQH